MPQNCGGAHARGPLQESGFQEQPCGETGPGIPGTQSFHPLNAPKLHWAQIYREIFNLSLPLCRAERITPHVFAVCTRSPALFPPRRVQLGCKSESCRGRPEHVKNTPALRLIALSRETLCTFMQFETWAAKLMTFCTPPGE